MENEFLRTRIAFIVLDDTLRVQDKKDTRTSMDWARVDLRMDQDAWAKSLRGYILPGRIQFFTGLHYRPHSGVTRKDIDYVVQQYNKYFPDTALQSIYNGIIPSTDGCAWDPILVWDSVDGVWNPVSEFKV